MKYLHNHDDRRGEPYRRRAQKPQGSPNTEIACQSGLWVSETGCCQMGLPGGVELRSDHRDEGGHSKHQSRWAQQPLAKCSVWVVPEISPPSTCRGMFKHSLTQTFQDQSLGNSSNHWQALLESTESSWNGKKQRPLQRPECDNTQRAWKDWNSYCTNLTLAPPGFPSCTEPLTKEKSYR